MNTSSIMRGDWLFYKGRFNAFPFKVEGVIEKKIGYYPLPDNKRMYYLNQEECYPIPLTSGILEKNGFILKEGEKGMYGVTTAPHYVRDDLPFEVFCDSEPFSIWFQDPVNIKYAHELQHILKLCGIYKEIVL